MTGKLLETLGFSLKILVELEAPEKFLILIIQSTTNARIHEYLERCRVSQRQCRVAKQLFDDLSVTSVNRPLIC